MFIWLGSEVPDYGKFCIDSFKQVNPDFEIMLVNEVDVEHPKNEDVKECLDLISSNEYNMYKHMVVRPFAVQKLASTKVKRMTAISDALRLYLLNKYGGIYLDLDTFPVKPFDERLLSYEGFAVNHKKDWCDYFFLGFNKHCVDDRTIRYVKQYDGGQIFDYSKVHKIHQYTSLFNTLNKCKHLDEKFKNCSLKYGECALRKTDKYSDYYIDHFRLGSWCR